MQNCDRLFTKVLDNHVYKKAKCLPKCIYSGQGNTNGAGFKKHKTLKWLFQCQIETKHANLSITSMLLIVQHQIMGALDVKLIHVLHEGIQKYFDESISKSVLQRCAVPDSEGTSHWV